MPGHNMLDKLARMGCNPFEVLASIAIGRLTCGVCAGRGKVRYLSAGDNKLRQCSSCHGSGHEHVSPADRGRAAGELARYCAPQLKSVEVHAPRGDAAPVWQIVLPGAGPSGTGVTIDAQPVLDAAIEGNSEDAGGWHETA